MRKTEMTKTFRPPGPPELAKPSKARAPSIRIGKPKGDIATLLIDEGENERQLLATFATTETLFATRLTMGLIHATGASELQEQDCNELLALVHGIAPRDGIEALLAVQMTATHNAVLKAMRNLKGSETTIQQDSNGNLANKLMRTFTTQIETLSRYRNAGQQQVVVKHVQVNAGQAIVGINMTEGGGAIDEN